MWIIKLGGSWLTNPNLTQLLRLLFPYKSVPITLVVGGGVFTDAVRFSQKYLKFDDEFAHNLALKATENYAKIINNKVPAIKLFSDLTKLKDKRFLKIWLPQKFLKNNKIFRKEWESTSDSVASWLDKKIKSKGVIFVKSIDFRRKRNLNIEV